MTVLIISHLTLCGWWVFCRLVIVTIRASRHISSLASIWNSQWTQTLLKGSDPLVLLLWELFFFPLKTSCDHQRVSLSLLVRGPLISCAFSYVCREGRNVRFLASSHIVAISPMGNIHLYPLPKVSNASGPLHWHVNGSFYLTCKCGLGLRCSQCLWNLDKFKISSVRRANCNQLQILGTL